MRFQRKSHDYRMGNVDWWKLYFFFLTRAWIFPTNLELPAWIIIAVIVIIGTAVGFSVFLESVKYIGPVKSTLLGCLEPASATSAGKERKWRIVYRRSN